MKKREQNVKKLRSLIASSINYEQCMNVLRIISFCFLFILTICGCTEEPKTYFKDDPKNFMLNIIDENTNLRNVIKEEWFSSFIPDEGTKYDLYITDEYFSVKKDSQEIKILNTGLFITDYENDRFFCK